MPSIAPPLVSLHDLERGARSVEDFCRTNLLLVDGLNARDAFRFLPLLSYVEAVVYKLDDENEALAARLPDDAEKADNVLGPLKAVLRDRGLLTPHVEHALAEGLEFWALERILCRAMIQDDDTTPPPIRESDVLRASALKSFDYRVMMGLVHAVLDQEPNPAVTHFLRTAEQLVDIADDLYDYESDVVANSFNVLRGLARCGGPDRLVALIASLEADCARARAALDPIAAANYRRREEEATREGGGSGGLGQWIFPALIVDETAYRERVMRETG